MLSVMVPVPMGPPSMVLMQRGCLGMSGHSSAEAFVPVLP